MTQWDSYGSPFEFPTLHSRIDLPSSMTSPRFNHAVDAWTVRAVVASRHLARLYRTLGDEKQAACALQSGAPAEERAQRLGLQPLIAAMQTQFANEHQEEVLGESFAWQALVEGYAGICALHAMVDGPERSRGLRGSKTVSDKAFLLSLKGYRIAFPEPMATDGITKALRAAADACRETFLEDLGEPENQEGLLAAGEEIYIKVLQALEVEAGLPVSAPGI